MELTYHWEEGAKIVEMKCQLPDLTTSKAETKTRDNIIHAAALMKMNIGVANNNGGSQSLQSLAC